MWEVCFNGFEEVHHWYDTVFTGCWWIFEEEYYIIHDILLPGFFIATQFFFTITMTCVLAAIFLTYFYLKKGKDDDHYVTLLLTLGTILVIGGKINNSTCIHKVANEPAVGRWSTSPIDLIVTLKIKQLKYNVFFI